MNALKLSRISIVMFGLGLACFTARPCRAQAEINPDHYDEAPSSSSIIRPATANQPVAANRSGAATKASTCAQAQPATDAKRTGCKRPAAPSSRVSRSRPSPCHHFARKREGQISPAARSRSQLGMTASSHKRSTQAAWFRPPQKCVSHSACAFRINR